MITASAAEFDRLTALTLEQPQQPFAARLENPLSTATVEGAPRPAPAAAPMSFRKHALFAHADPRFGATRVLNNRGGIRLVQGVLAPLSQPSSHFLQAAIQTLK
jgi:hypothetical protein